MKASWTLAPLLVAVLVVSGVPRTRVAEPPSAPTVHRTAQALDHAYRAAAAGGRWEALLEVGDAARRAGEESAEAKAREIYRAALARARQQESLDGVLRVAEALAALGDGKGAAESIRIAEGLAERDPEARADVRALAAQLPDAAC